MRFRQVGGYALHAALAPAIIVDERQWNIGWVRRERRRQLHRVFQRHRAALGKERQNGMRCVAKQRDVATHERVETQGRG